MTAARAHGGTHSAVLGGTNASTQSLSQPITVPPSATLRFWTYLTTAETGPTAYDSLTVKLGSATLQTLSNAGTAGSWVSTSVSVAGFGGQSLALSFTATNGTKLVTTFWVDDVSVG